MKVLLRNTRTRYFYRSPLQWTPDPEDALNLEQLSQAVGLAFEAHLEDVEVLLSFDDPQFNLVLPVNRPRA